MKTLFVLFIFIAVCAGQDVERRRAAAMPEVGINNLPAQPIGPDDLITLSVYDSPEFSRSIRVGPDGTVRIPMLKQRIKVTGMVPSAVEQVIADALVKAELLVDPIVSVTIAEYHSKPISVSGAVRIPVTFQAVGQVTLLDAISKAQGLSESAGSEVLVSRPAADGSKGTLVQRIPVKGLIDGADSELNVRLVGGEEIRVPEIGRFFVAGNVKKPGTFPVTDPADTTVLKALSLSEGLLPFSAKMAYIYRADDMGGAKKEIPIELSKIMTRKSPDVQLQAKDILYVPDAAGRRMAATTLDRISGFGMSTASGLLIWKH